MCHSRCRDDKAAVRKAALQLLLSALELRATQGQGAAATVEGPSEQDVAVLEEATADALVGCTSTIAVCSANGRKDGTCCWRNAATLRVITLTVES